MKRWEKLVLWSAAIGVAGVLVFGIVPKAIRDARELDAQAKRWNELVAARKALVTAYPLQIDPSCRRGRAKLYDECGDQVALLEAAKTHAARDGKVLLVSYGAEWCIWCHVFDAHVRGNFGLFSYAYGSAAAPDTRDVAVLSENPLIGGPTRDRASIEPEAKALHEFVSKSFVIIHIDAQFAKSGLAALEKSAATSHYQGALPFIFTVDRNGRFAAPLDSSRVESRREGHDWYRGYDRVKLQAHLAELRDAALSPGNN